MLRRHFCWIIVSTCGRLTLSTWSDGTVEENCRFLVAFLHLITHWNKSIKFAHGPYTPAVSHPLIPIILNLVLFQKLLADKLTYLSFHPKCASIKWYDRSRIRAFLPVQSSVASGLCRRSRISYMCPKDHILLRCFFYIWPILAIYIFTQVKTNKRRKKNREFVRDFGSNQTLSLIALVSSASKSVFFCWLCWVHLCMGALWLAEPSLWHPVEPCFLSFILMTALSVYHNHSLQLSTTNPVLHYSFLFPLPLSVWRCLMAGLLLSIPHPQ